MKNTRPTYLIGFVLTVLCIAAALTTSSQATSAPTLRTVVTSIAPSARNWSYGWPLKPFDQQHPVRSFLNEPRIVSPTKATFHFGIDIAAPDGTPVYAVEAGTVYIDNPMAIAVVAPAGHSFGYWHIVPVVKSHQFVTRHQLLGRVGKGWEHVHFAERRGGVYVNPLRPGGVGPYVDRTAPAVITVIATSNAIIVEAEDTQSPKVPGAWEGEPLTPAFLRWRLAGTRTWTTFVDFGRTLQDSSKFWSFYAPQTRQNHRGEGGRLCFYLLRGSKAASVLAGGRPIEIEASDSAGNRTVVVWLDV